MDVGVNGDKKGGLKMVLQKDEYRIEDDGIWISKKASARYADEDQSVFFDGVAYGHKRGYQEAVDACAKSLENNLP